METLHLQVRAPQLYPDIRMLRARASALDPTRDFHPLEQRGPSRRTWTNSHRIARWLQKV